ncbi:MAG: hypothetical protein QOJ65_1462 [Fimbriimonadaceae bacterium]|jgi:5-hydroxyisourate hydrolase-like protein (transthyretin family)|nr:hypothetical protein [Fimbriimonadaceae bacterium]
MHRTVVVHILETDGSPKPAADVSLQLHAVVEGVALEPKTTDKDGVAQFSLDMEKYAELTIYVAGHERVSRGPIQDEYYITVN